MDDQMRYLKLTDYDNRGKVVRQVGFCFYIYDKYCWYRIASIPYFYPDAAEYECYEKITEDEARKIIGNGIDSMALRTVTQGKLGEYFAAEDEYFEMCRIMTVPKDIDKITDM